MYRLFLIAKNNVKKQKGDMFTFFILTFIAAFLIFDCASVILGLGKIMEDRFHAINGAHVMIINADTEAETDSAERAIGENPNIIDYERTPILNFTAEYRKKGDETYSTYQFIVQSYEQDKRIMNVEVPSRQYLESDVLLPYHLKGTYGIGDVMQIRFGEDVYDFTVVGYLEDPYFCSTVNLTVYAACMSGKMMDELAQKYPASVMKGYVHKGVADETKLTGSYGTMELERDVTKKYKEYLSEYEKTNPEGNYTNYMGVNWDMMSGGSKFIPQIVTSIILAFAMLILVIALVIISFSIHNFIQRNMKNTGILEASGYTVKELRASLVLQILIVAAIGSVFGIGAAILSFGKFGEVAGSVLGLGWNQPVNVFVAIMTITGTLLVIGLTGLWISRAYKKITVLDALRGGINAHNFRRNYFPFEKTPLPVSLVLALKDTFSGIGRNLLMVFISAILVISTLIGFGMVENFAKDSNGLMKIMAFELCTDVLIVNNDGKDVSEELRGLEGVENVLVNIGFEPAIRVGDREQAVYAYVVDDLNHSLCTNLLEGRYPVQGNEILVTRGVANDMGLKVGDVVEVEFAGKKADFVITGINQRVERMGRTLYLRIDGARQIFPGNIMSACQYYVTAKDGISYETLRNEIDRYAAEKGLSVRHADMQATMDSTVAMVTAAMKAICLVIALLTVVIVIFVESLVIRAKIAREWRGMGISKALGQTSGGLIVQIMLSNVPAILTGAIIGGILSPVAGGGIIMAAFSLFAVKKISFYVPAFYVMLTIAGIIIVAILSSAVAGLKVRKLKPVTMITEE